MAESSKGNEAVIPQKLLHELLDYEPTAGGFVNKTNRASNARVGQPAGYVEKKSGYIRIGINGYQYLAHRLAWVHIHGNFPEGEQPFIDHINGKRADNRIANLRCSSSGENNRNQKKNSRNKSGVVGVGRYEVKIPSGKVYIYWIATWRGVNGKTRSKQFPVHKLGEDEAKQLAIAYRAEQIRLLEINHGITYSNRHGN